MPSQTRHPYYVTGLEDKPNIVPDIIYLLQPLVIHDGINKWWVKHDDLCHFN